MLSLLSKVSEVGQSEDGDRKWSLIILEGEERLTKSEPDW
jgi:hypothetical protein